MKTYNAINNNHTIPVVTSYCRRHCIAVKLGASRSLFVRRLSGIASSTESPPAVQNYGHVSNATPRL